jgi:hypothetical protein
MARLLDVDVECSGIDVDVYRRCSGVTDSRHRGEESEGDGDHFVAWSNASPEQRQVQGAGPGIDADGVVDTAIRRELFFKRLGLGAQNELAALENARDGGVDFGLELAILRGEI